jgi:hypothetical protein
MKVGYSASRVGAAILMSWAVSSPVFPEPDFEFTKIVDTNGTPDANFSTIQAAIDDIDDNQTVRWTVLIYAGVYAENVTLDDTKENVDLVGIDGGSVIIAPSSGDGVVITSGAETVRNNAIRNLTIQTTSGHGIKIESGTAVAAHIQVENVTIEADGSDKHGVFLEFGTDVLVRNCNIDSDDGDAFHGDLVRRLTIDSSTLTAMQGLAVSLIAVSGATSYEDISVLGSRLVGGLVGMRILLGERILIQDSDIVCNNSESDFQEPVALFFDRLSGNPSAEPSDIVALDCRIRAICEGHDGKCIALGTDALGTDTDTFPKVINCDISATADEDPVYGVYAGGGTSLDPNVILIGGTVTSHCDNEKETEVFDLRQNSGESVNGELFMSGTRMTKWKGPIKTAERKRSVVQRTLNISSPDNDGILTTTGLTGSEQSLTSGFSNPDVYRMLTVTGNMAGMDQDVFIVGTNFGGVQITDKITLNGTATVDGHKPFGTVSKIILPARTAADQKVLVGTSGIIGLQFPIESGSDVLQVGRKASAASSYTILASIGTVSDEYSTADITSQLTAGNSFEFVALASE